jgi:rSAM/selenodomain-associated transferase 2/rSAM/selenodomain-associated transferase 1
VTAGPSLSVVIPTLNEEERLPTLLTELGVFADEVIVVDGGSTDGTEKAAKRASVHFLETRPGRGEQLRAGADAAGSEWLFFVHADCRVGPDVTEAIREFLSDARSDDFAHFRFGLEGSGSFHGVIEFGQRLREKLLGLPYGDQGLIVSRELYAAVSGYPDWPLMEDVGILDRLRRKGRRVALSPRLKTSPRRYEEAGALRGWLRNIALMTLFRLGVSPARLVRWYAPRSGSPVFRDAATLRTVVLFAKAPVPGYVKTRLAAEVGPHEATRIYRTLGRDTADALRAGAGRLIAYVDPPDAGTIVAVADWLGRDGIEFRLQSEGDLGERMSLAARECLDESDAVCIVGSDIPGLGADSVDAAFRALENHDVVLGPATDGGYYLIAIRETNPGLFDEIPWSTADVLTATLERASALGLSVSLLEPKTDVDTLADVPAALLAG